MYICIKAWLGHLKFNRKERRSFFIHRVANYLIYLPKMAAEAQDLNTFKIEMDGFSILTKPTNMESMQRTGSKVKDQPLYNGEQPQGTQWLE